MNHSLNLGQWLIVKGIGPVSLAAVVSGFVGGLYELVGVGAIGLILAAKRWYRRRQRQATAEPNPVATSFAALPTAQSAPRSNDPESLIQEMFRQGRCALLLRPQIVENLDDDLLQRSVSQLDSEMSLVPEGEVVVGAIDELLDEGKVDVTALKSCFASVLRVEPVFLDRTAVTNHQYLHFVQAGGYEQMAIWDQEILPATLDFVDQSGRPGPRLWIDGMYAEGTQDHPVVGVSWYEAAAYARWVGKRLPTDAEWVKAGCWPINVSPGVWIERKYPWGNAFDPLKANLWGSDVGHTVSVHAFEDGLSVGGAQQLIGNTWEWTHNNFGHSEDLSLTLPVPMKSLRGGAYDTYFENQATCHFQSGENPLSRKHNIGFRLALGVCDLAAQVTEQIFGGAVGESVPETSEVCA